MNAKSLWAYILLALLFPMFSIANEISNDFVSTFKAQLIKEYEFIAKNNKPSRSLKGFLEKVVKSWESSYNNTPVKLNDNGCVFWLGLSQLEGSYNDNFSDDFLEHASYLHELLSERLEITQNHRKACKVWINKSTSVSIIDLKSPDFQLHGKLVSLKGVVYSKGGLNALFLTREHFRTLDLSNAITLSSEVGVSTDLHGELAWIEGRLLSHVSQKPDEKANYLYLGRVLHIYE